MNIIRKLVHINGPTGIYRKFSVSSMNSGSQSCKLLVLGGGSGGCTIAAKFARRLKKDEVIVLEPNPNHYYQPLWTLVGAGVKSVADTRRSAAEVLPEKAIWVRDCATSIDPEKNTVTLNNGTISYEYLVIATGLHNDYDRILGLEEALKDPRSGVSTIFSEDYCEKTWRDMQNFKGGVAMFTYPEGLIKCPGAPQKIAYLADSFFNMVNIREKTEIQYNTSLPVIFGVKKYANELLKVANRKNIKVNYRHALKEIHADKKEAVFEQRDDHTRVTKKYDMLHVSPSMKTSPFLRCNTSLVDENGFLDVDKYTLQHTKYKNIYGIGDCTNTPNSKTAAAIAKQSLVLELNLLSTMKKNEPKANYDGYGACPLVTSFNTVILAEFLYDGVVHETMPFDQSKESRIAFYMKRDLFPFIYWNMMLKGNYHGPEFIRKIINPFGN